MLGCMGRQRRGTMGATAKFDLSCNVQRLCCVHSSSIMDDIHRGGRRRAQLWQTSSTFIHRPCPESLRIWNQLQPFYPFDMSVQSGLALHVAGVHIYLYCLPATRCSCNNPPPRITCRVTRLRGRTGSVYQIPSPSIRQPSFSCQVSPAHDSYELSGLVGQHQALVYRVPRSLQCHHQPLGYKSGRHP